MPVSSHLVRAGHSQIGVGPLAYGELLAAWSAASSDLYTASRALCRFLHHP